MPHRNPIPPHLEPTDPIDLYAAALKLSTAPRSTPVHERLLNFLYFTILIGIFAWFASMAFDRVTPVRWISREVVNPDRRVRAGEQLLIKATRTRSRQCELVKRQSIVDGNGRRLDFEPERFDAYGAVTEKPDVDITGPIVPLDAYPGRGRAITTFAWDCNMLQKATGWSITEVQTLEFEIAPRAGS